MGTVEFEDNGWDSPSMKVIIYSDKPIHWQKAGWEKFKKKVDEYFELLDTVDIINE